MSNPPPAPPLQQPLLVAEPSELPTAVIRQSPEDFQVEEIPAYPPSGEGTHCFITIRKTGLTTPEAVRRIASALEVDPRGAGHAGMKDRHAVTVQTVSLPFPESRDLDQAVGGLSVPGVEVLGAARHGHKLKPGHLRGNRFTITLRQLDEAALEPTAQRLLELGRRGVPNAYGPQRFGRDGANPARALSWLGGESRGPRNRSEQRMLFSAVQSMLFNRVLARRVRDGSWETVLPGDLAKKHDSGGLFLVPLAGAELEEARQRASAAEISPTGPMFGPKMRWPEGEVAEIEREVLQEVFDPPSRLDAFKKLGQGTRRPLRLLLEQPSSTAEPAGGALTVAFVLPKGGYATTVLAELCQLQDHAAPARREQA